MSRPKIHEVIVVEGRYDKNTLAQAVDAAIFTTDGFGVFKDADKKRLFARLAHERGLIVLTDGDGAGFVIRNHLKGVLGARGVKHAYIPDRYGKERRKRAPGKEGKLGVEGLPPGVLIEALRRAGATFVSDPPDAAGPPEVSGRGPAQASGGLTKADLMRAGLCGGPDSAARRAALLKRLELPERLTANGLLEALNLLYTREAFDRMILDEA